MWGNAPCFHMRTCIPHRFVQFGESENFSKKYLTKTVRKVFHSPDEKSGLIFLAFRKFSTFSTGFSIGFCKKIGKSRKTFPDFGVCGFYRKKENAPNFGECYAVKPTEVFGLFLLPVLFWGAKLLCESIWEPTVRKRRRLRYKGVLCTMRRRC